MGRRVKENTQGAAGWAGFSENFRGGGDQATRPITRRADASQLARAAAIAMGLLTVLALVVPAAIGLTSADPDGTPQLPPQSLTVVGHASLATAERGSYEALPGIDTYVAGGTNHDWAKLVLLYGGWPRTDDNVTVILRWMRQENYVKSWWNRNNPLNNGWGSGGGGGLGSYPNLRVAAENAAEALHTHPGYADIRAAFAASAPTEVTEAAIWWSPWATSHYNNGAHWHYSPVEVVQAPASAW